LGLVALDRGRLGLSLEPCFVKFVPAKGEL